MPQQQSVTNNAVRLVQPGAGQTVTVPINADDMRLSLGFVPDPNAVAKNGQNLEFSFEDGGKIVLEGYYDHFANKTLPVMVTEGGDELPGEDFLASLNEDLLTAAGPGAGSASASGGSGEYSDDAGALIGGIDRLGSLGTMYWGYDSEIPEEHHDTTAFPGGSGEWDVTTDLPPGIGGGAGMVLTTVFEDAKPWQNELDPSLNSQEVYGVINFTFTGIGATECRTVTFTGFHEGTEIFYNGAWYTVGGVTEPVKIPYDQLAAGSVLIKPPFNSDADMQITTEMEIGLPGASSMTIGGPAGTIVVDSVADLPGSFAASGQSDAMQAGMGTPGAAASTEVKNVTIDVDVAYGDSFDGSERHFIDIKDIPSDWTLEGFPGTWQLVDADGNAISFEDVTRTEHGSYDLRFEVVDHGVVDEADHSAHIQGEVKFNPHDWTSAGATDADGTVQNDTGRYNDGTAHTDGPAEIKVSASAEETPKDGEMLTSNNVAQSDTVVIEIAVTEDKASINSTTTISANENAASGDESLTALSSAALALVSAAGGAGAPLSVSSGIVTFDLKSDGMTEHASNAPTVNKTAMMWDEDAMPSLSAKISGAEGTTYATLTFEVDPANPQVVTGYFMDGSTKVVAVIGVIEADYATGQATVSFVQYHPLQHPTSSATPEDLSSQFGVKVTDDDGDVTKGSVTYKVTDDVPLAFDNAASFDEETLVPDSDGSLTIGGNVITDANASGQADAPGADGFGGLTTITVTLPDGSVVTKTFSSIPESHDITVMNPDTAGGAPSTIQAGTLTVKGDGTWSFTSAQGQGDDITKDFEIKAEYTYQDGDGDTAKANLVIDVDAAPLSLGLSGTKIVAESTVANAAGEDAGAPAHAHGVAEYTITVGKHNGDPAGGEAIAETITAHMRINLPADGASRADFDFTRIGNDGFISYTYELNGVTQTGQAKITTTGSPATKIEFDIEIPAGAEGTVKFELPIADDSVGGKGADSQDALSDGFSVEMVGVTTATPGVVDFPTDPADNPKVDTVIIDDGAQWDGSQWDYVGNELSEYAAGVAAGTNTHRLDGPVVDVAVSGVTNGQISEDGPGATVAILLSQFTGTGAGATAWTPGTSDGLLAEKITFTVQLNPGDVDNGVNFQMTAAMFQLIKAGKVTIELSDGTTIDSSNYGSYPAGTNLSADAAQSSEITITLTESFKPSTDAGGLTITARPVGDTVHDDPSLDQTFEVKITGTTGHESLYDKNGETVEVADNANGGYLHLTGNTSVAEGGTLNYKLQLVTSQTGSTKLADSQIQGDMQVTLAFTATDKHNVSGGNMADGAEAGSDYLASLTAALAVNTATADYANQPAILALKAELGLHADIDILKVESDGNGGFKLQLDIPETAWNNGEIQISLPTIKDELAGEPTEWLNVKVDGYEASGTGQQEVQGMTNGATNGVNSQITDPRIEMTIEGTKTIWEESWNGANVAKYEVSFTQASGHGGTVANGQFAFDLTLKNGSASFYDGDPANAPTTGGADYQWVIVDGGGNATGYDLTDATGKTDFLDALQAQLDSVYGAGNVTVTMPGASNSLHFVVAEGTELHDLPVYVQAIDDQHSDSGEDYSIVIEGLTYDPDDVQVAITDRDETTTIHDGSNTGRGSGQWLGLVQTEVAESTADVVVGVKLYNQGDYNGTLYSGVTPPTESMILTFGYADNSATGNEDYVTSANKASIGATEWKAYDASGNVVIEYTGGQWVHDLDGDGTFDPVPLQSNGSPDWDAFSQNANASTVEYWQANPVISGLINDDRLDEGSEDFTIWIESVTGNESAPLYGGSQSSPVNESGSTVTIKDDETNKGVSGATDIKDGPRLEAFVLNGKLIEPEAVLTDGDGTADPMPHTTSAYTIAFDAVAAEDIVISLDLATNGAVRGEDFSLGKNIMLGSDLLAHYGSDLPDYLDASSIDANGYYVVVPKGSSSVSFEINVLHDHDTADNGRGMDEDAEKLEWTITDMVGSEVQWGTGAGYTNTDLTATAPIEDDARGPFVAVSVDPSSSFGSGVSGSIYLVGADSDGIALGESINVTLTLLGSDGKTYTLTLDPSQCTIGTDGTSVSFSGVALPAEMSGLSYFYVCVGATDGAESRVDPGISAPVYNHGGNPLVVKVSAEDIYEGGVNGTAAPETVTYDINVSNLQNYAGSSAAFTIRPVNATTENEDFEGGSPADVRVELSQTLIDQMKATGEDDFSIQLVPGADGTVAQVIVTVDGASTTYTVSANGEFRDGSSNLLGTVKGGDGNAAMLPTADDDNVIEGNEDFTAIVVNPSGVIPAPEAPETTAIIDNDNVQVNVSFGYADGASWTNVTGVTEGEMEHASGNNYVVRVALTDGSGPLVLDANEASPITIVLTVKATASSSGGINTDNDGGFNEDMVVFTQEVTIYPGESLADVRVTFPDDFISDDGKQFTIEAAFKDTATGSTANIGNTGMTGSIVVDSGLANGVTINDYINGPVASLVPYGGFVGQSLSEATEASSAHYVIKLDKALEEDASVGMKFSFDDVSDTALGVTPADVKSVTIDGTEYTVTANGDGTLTLTASGVPSLSGAYTVSSGGNVTAWEIKVPMTDGSSGVRVSVNFENDSISENTESLKVELTTAEGGEMTVGSGNTLTTSVEEVKDGPDVSLNTSGEYASAVEGESAFVGLTLTQAGKEDFDVLLTVKDVSVLGDMTALLHYYKDGAWHEASAPVTIGADGKLTVTVPAGATEAKVEFDTKDNVLTGANDPLEVSLDGVQYGEAGILGGASYGGSFVEETYNSMTFHVGGASSEAMASQTQLTVSLGVIDPADVSSVKIGSASYGSGSLVDLGGGVMGIVIDCPAGTKVNYNVTVTFKDDAVDNKKELAVSASETGQAGLVQITDDVNTVHQDGPEFSVVSGPGSNGEEGDTLTFAIKPNPQTGFTTSQEEITLTFKVSGANADTGAVTVDGVTAVHKGSGVYEVKLPAGTDLTNDLTVNVATKTDNKVDTNSTVTVELTKVTGGEATVDSSAKTAQGAVSENAATTAALVVTQNSSLVYEGTNLSFTLALTDGVNNMTASEAMTVTFLVTGADGLELGTDLVLSDSAGKWAWTDNDDGTYNLTVTLPAGSGSMTVGVPVTSDGLDETGEGVSFVVVDSNTGSLTNVTAPSGGTEIAFNVSDPLPDPSIVNLTGDENFDGTSLGASLGTGLTINGGDGDNDIIGSAYGDTIYGGTGDDTIDGGAGNDTIYGGIGNDTILGGLGNDVINGGAGNDILVGGAGDDTFVWRLDDLNTDGTKATDIIRDFSMKADQAGLTADGTAGQDTLDLSALVDTKGSVYTLEDFVSISKDADGNAVLDVRTEASGDVVQTIILADVYNNYMIEGNDDAVTQMIKDHILINSGG